MWLDFEHTRQGNDFWNDQIFDPPYVHSYIWPRANKFGIIIYLGRGSFLGSWLRPLAQGAGPQEPDVIWDPAYTILERGDAYLHRQTANGSIGHPQKVYTANTES